MLRGIRFHGQSRRLDHVPRAGHGEFKAAWNRLDNDVVLLHSRLLELLDCAFEEGLDNDLVPPCVHNGDAEWGTVELDIGGLDALDCVVGAHSVALVVDDDGSALLRSDNRGKHLPFTRAIENFTLAAQQPLERVH